MDIYGEILSLKTLGQKRLSQEMKTSAINHQEEAVSPSQHKALFIIHVVAVKGLEKKTLVYFLSSCNSSNVIDILSVAIYNIKVQVIYNGCLKIAQSFELKSLNVPQRTKFLLIRYMF